MKVGITGNIGAGKSAVEEILTARGFKVLDADKAAHEVLAKELPGIQRETLSKIAFSNPAFRKKLEALVHPGVRKIIEAGDAEFVAVPLLFEAEFQDLFDKIILVTAPENTRLERILQRGYTVEHAKNRMNSQLPQEQKIPLADFVIKNNGTLAELEAAVDAILSWLAAVNGHADEAD